jgi:tRNA (mo5U34)-methyltransferase
VSALGQDELAARVREIDWYHTLELAPGVVTDGVFDLRPWVGRYGLPERMDGMRVLDAGSFDGFWAFECERRGAAEVLALDLDRESELDWPPRRRPREEGGSLAGRGFALAREVLGSSVQRVTGNLYDLDPSTLGTFDLVICGVVLVHMRDQLLGLERLARVCRGILITAEAYDPWMSLLPLPAARYLPDRDASVVFWLPGIGTWRRMLHTAGFDEVRRHTRFRMPSRRGYAVRHVVHHASGSSIAGVSLPPRGASPAGPG